MIKVEHLKKSYGENEVLKDISFTVARGEVVALIGFSGSGKSTALRIVAGLDKCDSGTVKLSSEKVSMSFQYSALFDSLSVRDNIAFPFEVGENLKPLSLDVINKKVDDTLNLVGLPNTQDLFPAQLSGGMKKRVSFARAIIDDPEIILYDEPTAGLDPMASTVIEDLIVKLQHKMNAASVVVTHQCTTIKRTAQRVLMLYGGCLVWEGTPEELFNP
ncbi:MAG: ATP-binding cassette domain-containing protein, partial [Candidatus Melainabacteria bacterium]|nr:ATP-binding cassette domain-containing protein [Candidatus Melainabacteria bacterium]